MNSNEHNMKHNMTDFVIALMPSHNNGISFSSSNLYPKAEKSGKIYTLLPTSTSDNVSKEPNV